MRARFRLDSTCCNEGVVESFVDKNESRSHSPHRLITSWWDTFDWRLWRAGLVLSQEGGSSGPTTWRLEPRDGGRPLARAVHESEPRFATDFAPGPLRKKLEPIVAPRRLLLALRLGARRRDFARTDSRGKRVLNVHVDEITEGPASARGAKVVTVDPLRGYEGEAAELETRLRACEGITPLDAHPLIAFGTRDGREPGDDPSRRPIQIPSSEPIRVAAARILSAQAEVMEVNRPGLVEDWDPEFLHDWRVAVRRTRSLLKELKRDLPPELIQKCQRLVGTPDLVGQRVHIPLLHLELGR